MSDDELDFRERSRSTRWRRKGPSKRRHLSTSSDDEDNNAPAPVPQQAEDGERCVEGEVLAPPICGGHLAHLGATESLAGDLNSDVDSDTDWSEDLRNEYIEEESVAEDEGIGLPEVEDCIIDIDYEEENLEQPHDSDESLDSSGDFLALNHRSLSQVLEFAEDRTVKDSLLLDLALSVRHKLNYECLIQSFRTKNFLMGSKYFPKNKKELFAILGKRPGVRTYLYCSACDYFLGRKDKFGNVVYCPICKTTKSTKKVGHFVSLILKKQLQHFLSIPGVAEFLRYRETRIKREESAIEDIFDGIEYQKIEVEGEKLFNSNNYTYVFNTDGCKIRKGAKLSIYPLFIRINELPPNLRQKFMFLAGIFVDYKEPDMISFLDPFVSQLNSLAETGVRWTRDGEEIVSKFLPTCFCVDGKARAQILNMVGHAGYHACSHCTYQGVHVENTMRYPLQHEDIPPCAARTHETMLVDMVHRNLGFKGPTALALLKGFNLVKGAATDDLHYFYECASKQHTELLLTVVPKVDPGMPNKIFFETIDSRLKSIKTPSLIARKPGTCKIKNRLQKKGSEWRNWLLYYAPVCLQNLIPNQYIQHLERLSHATYLLSLDIISNEDVENAERLIKDYLSLYDQYFGIENTRLNLHSLLHAADSVKNWGALWCYSTFNFESWNHKIMQLVTSPNGALQQIVTRHLIQSTLQAAMFADNEISPDVVDQMKQILNKRRHVNARQVSQHIHVTGGSSERQPSCEELQVLQQEGLHTERITVHKKIIIRSVEYTSTDNQLEGSRSDDKSIFTFQNTFCTIKNIVTFTSQDGCEHCGLFVFEHEVVQRDRPLFLYAKHIVQIRENNADLFHFISADLVRSPVVKAQVLGDIFFIPVPNSFEID